MSSIIDYTDRATCVLFGDGAGVAVLGPAEDGEPYGILDYVHEIDGSGGPALQMPAGGSRLPASHETVDKRLHYVHQDGQAVFKFAVRKTEEICRRLLAQERPRSPTTSICSSRTRPTAASSCRAAEKLGLAPERVVINIERFGNTTGATIPLALERRHRRRPADEGQARDADVGGRRLHGRLGAAAVGVLTSATSRPTTEREPNALDAARWPGGTEGQARALLGARPRRRATRPGSTLCRYWSPPSRRFSPVRRRRIDSVTHHASCGVGGSVNGTAVVVGVQQHAAACRRRSRWPRSSRSSMASPASRTPRQRTWCAFQRLVGHLEPGRSRTTRGP